jgi:octaprenyl-diphosphate synthase
LSSAAMVISEGEVMQLSLEGNLGINQDTYLKVVSAKTAELFAAATEVGAVLAGQAQSYINALRDYGYYLGVAFQIADDALDYSAQEAGFGKHIGDDFKESKITLPVLLAYEAATPEEKEFWQRTLTQRQQQEGDLEMAISFVGKHQAAVRSLEVAEKYLEKANQALSVFPESDMKQALIDILAFVIEREY